MNSFIENLAAAIALPADGIAPATKLADLPNWDSLAILTTLSMVDFEYSVSLTGLDLQNCATVSELYLLVRERGGDRI